MSRARVVLSAMYKALHGRMAFAAVPLGHYLGARFGVLFTSMPEGTAILWPPNSVLLAALLLRDGRGFWPLAALVMLAELLADLPVFSPVEALLFGAINVAEARLAFALLRRCRFDHRLGTSADLRSFLVAGPVLAAFVAAVAGAGVYRVFRGGAVGYGEFLRLWWFGDALGLLVFTPLVLTLPEGMRRLRTELPDVLPADAAVLLLAALTLAALVASPIGWIDGRNLPPVLLLPVAVAVAARFSLPVATVTAAVMAMAVAFAASRGHAIFGFAEPREVVIRTQGFILVLSLVTIGLAALLSELRVRNAQIQAANAGLEAANRELEARVRAKTERLEALNLELERLALTDPLTSVPNRRAFFEQAGHEFDGSRRHGTPLSVLMVDLDHFKAINDQHGHAAGDKVLQQVAIAMREVLRGGDTIARYGGEEFVVLAPHTGLEDATALAQRMCEHLARRVIPTDGGALQVTCSIGVAARLAGDADLSQLLARADAALYRAKRAGRDRVSAAA